MGIQHQALSLEHRALSIEHRALSIEHGVSNKLVQVSEAAGKGVPGLALVDEGVNSQVLFNVHPLPGRGAKLVQIGAS